MTLIARNLGGGVIGPDGCLYADNGLAVFKVTDASGGCSFASTSAAPTLRLAPGSVTPDPAQGSEQTFTATLRGVTAPAGTPVFFQVAGANPRVQMVRADGSGRAALTYTGESQGKDVVSASASAGGAELVSNRARVTWGPGRHVTFLGFTSSPTAGTPGRPTGVIASLTDIAVQPPVRVPGASVDFALGEARCSAVTDASGIATCPITPAEIGVGVLEATFVDTAQLVGSRARLAFASLCPAGLDGVTCYLDAFTAALDGAASGDVKPKVRKQLQARVKSLRKLVLKAGAPGKKGAKALRKLGKRLDALGRQVGKLKPRKVATPLRDALVGLASGARARVP